MASRFYTSIDINGTLQLYIIYCMCTSHLDNRHYILRLLVCIMCIIQMNMLSSMHLSRYICNKREKSAQFKLG